MKIRHQHIDNIKPESRGDENIRFTGKTTNMAKCGIAGFQNTQTCSPDRHDASACFFGGDDLIGNVSRNRTPFGMHFMLGNIFHRYRQKCSGTNMQCHRRNIDAFGFQCCCQPVGKMKTGCWCGNRPALAGKHGLVIITIGIKHPVGAGDIGRQRHRAISVKPGIQLRGIQRLARNRINKGQHDITACPAPQNLCGKVGGKDDNIIGAAFLGGLGEHPPDRIPLMFIPLIFMKCHADFGLAALANQPCRNNRRIIDNQQITRLQQIGQITNMPVSYGITRQIKKSGTITRFCRCSGDPVLRQIKIKI